MLYNIHEYCSTIALHINGKIKKLFLQSPKLKTGYRYKTSFENRVSLMRLGSFVNISIFVMKYYFI